MFRVLFSPLRAFEEIAKVPNVRGPLLIFLITLLASISIQFVSSSKILLEVEAGSGAYIPLAETSLFTDRLILTLTDSAFRFFLNWLIYGAALLLILKLFRTKEGAWHRLFIIVGYTFIVAAVFVIINAILISTLPTISFDYQTWTQAFLEGDVEAQSRVIQGYENNWVGLPAYQIGYYLTFVNEVWVAALGAIAIHFLREVSWNKALTISAIASVLSLFLRFPMIF